MNGRSASLDHPEGRYANYFKVGHNPNEFVLEFGQAYAEGGEPRLHTRIITSPAYAKELHALVGQSIAQYEEMSGPIRILEKGENQPES